MADFSNPFYIGTDDTLHFTVFQSDGTSIQNVSGFTTQLKVLGADAVVLTVSGSVVSAAAGTIDVAIASADTSSFKPGEYEYYFRRTNSGSRTVLATGKIQLKEAGAAWT